MFVGDALAMAVHWYDEVAAVQRDFGTVRDFQSPCPSHPNSIMSLACDIAESLGFPAAKVVGQVNRDQRSDLHVMGGLLSPACYIEHSIPAVLYLAVRYSNDFEAALVA
jgi:hypothetical protein